MGDGPNRADRSHPKAGAIDSEGARHGCPAAKVTLQNRFQRSLARRIPDATVVEDSRSAARTTARPAGLLRLPFPRWRKG
ncbi:hypothetical protein [Kocuria sp.]|uniref:hypothetical protein n=1 Tax=Kocuria sp. TaxID=1871328 RepID=UPI0028B2160B|nr:hypothetical protein [Kocuria sp.]